MERRHMESCGGITARESREGSVSPPVLFLPYVSKQSLFFLLNHFSSVSLFDLCCKYSVLINCVYSFQKVREEYIEKNRRTIIFQVSRRLSVLKRTQARNQKLHLLREI